MAWLSVQAARSILLKDDGISTPVRDNDSDSSLLAVHRKSQQGIARHPVLHVAGVDDDRTAADSRAGNVQRSSSCGHAAGGLVSLSCINIPDDRSVGRGIGVQVTAARSREDNARN